MQTPAAVAKPTPVAEVTLSEGELARYAGWYRDPSSGGVLRIFMRDGRLTTSDVEGDDIPFELTPAGGGRFFILLDGIPVNRLEFRSAPGGSATELQMFPAGLEAQPQVFHRVRPAASPKDLSALAGNYRSEELDVTYSVNANGAGLVMHPPGKPTITLEHLEPEAISMLVVLLVAVQAPDATGQTDVTPSTVRCCRTHAATQRGSNS